jgi:PilZ domain
MPGLESTEWPDAGTAIRVFVRDDPTEYPSRVHEGGGPILLVAAPRKLAVSQPSPGDTIHLWWGAKYGARMCRTRLMSIEVRPLPGWRLEALETPVEVQRRRHARIPVDRSVVIRFGGRAVPARMVDRSLHGARCFVPVSTRLDVGDVVEIEIEGDDVVHGATVLRAEAVEGQLQVAFSW